MWLSRKHLSLVYKPITKATTVKWVHTAQWKTTTTQRYGGIKIQYYYLKVRVAQTRGEQAELWDAGGHLVREPRVCVWSLCFSWRPNWPGSKNGV